MSGFRISKPPGIRGATGRWPCETSEPGHVLQAALRTYAEPRPVRGTVPRHLQTAHLVNRLPDPDVHGRRARVSRPGIIRCNPVHLVLTEDLVASAESNPGAVRALGAGAVRDHDWSAPRG